MYLKKNASFGRKFNFNLSGLTFKAKGARLRRFEITDVRKGSGADKAGIMIGDELVTINGLPAGDYDLNAINYFFDVRPGKRIRLELMREGKKIVKKMVLINQI